jgi:hypothetical protein
VSVHLPLLTVSRARSFRRCPRHNELGYELGYRAREKSNPLSFGSLFHRAEEVWWSTDRNHRLTAAVAVIRANQDGVDEFDIVKAEELIVGYDARWGDERMNVERVEAQFSLELRNPITGAASRTWRLAGKIDAIVTIDGRPWIVEHKTTSDDITPGSAYWQKLRLDAQVSTYLEGANALGFDVVGCIYDVIAKPALRPLKATPLEDRKYTKKDGKLYANQREHDETPEEFRLRLREHIAENPDRYYGRGEVVRLEQEAQDAAWDLWQTAKSIRDAQVAGRWPRNPEACFQWNRACEYFPVCTGQARIEDESIYRKVESVHEELNDANSTATEPAR